MRSRLASNSAFSDFSSEGELNDHSAIESLTDQAANLTSTSATAVGSSESINFFTRRVLTNGTSSQKMSSEESNKYTYSGFGQNVYYYSSRVLANIQVFTTICLGVSSLGLVILHQGKNDVVCQVTEYGLGKSEKFINENCTAARTDVFAFTFVVSIMFSVIMLLIGTGVPVKSELVELASSKQSSEDVEEYIKTNLDDSKINRCFTASVILWMKEMILIILFSFTATLILVTLNANYNGSEKFSFHSLINVNSINFLPGFTVCNLNGLASFGDTLKASKNISTKSISVACFLNSALTLRIIAFYLICELYLASFIIFCVCIIKNAYFLLHSESSSNSKLVNLIIMEVEFTKIEKEKK